MDCPILWYAIPALPLITRGLLCLAFRRLMGEVLAEAEHDRDALRAHLLPLAGFSFSGVLGLVVLMATATTPGFERSIYYLLVSFLAFMSALNLQGYKATRWQDQLATALMEVGTLSMILTLVSVLYSASFQPAFSLSLSLLAVLVWATDHLLRLSFQWSYLTEKEKNA